MGKIIQLVEDTISFFAYIPKSFFYTWISLLKHPFSFLSDQKKEKWPKLLIFPILFFIVNYFFYYYLAEKIFDKHITSFEVLLECNKKTQFEILDYLDMISILVLQFNDVPKKEKLFLFQAGRYSGDLSNRIFKVHKDKIGKYFVWQLRDDIVVTNPMAYKYPKLSGFNKALENHPFVNSIHPSELVKHLHRSKDEGTRNAGDEFVRAISKTKMHKLLYTLYAPVLGGIFFIIISSLIIHLVLKKSGYKYLFTLAILVYLICISMFLNSLYLDVIVSCYDAPSTTQIKIVSIVGICLSIFLFSLFTLAFKKSHEQSWKRTIVAILLATLVLGMLQAGISYYRFGDISPANVTYSGGWSSKEYMY